MAMVLPSEGASVEILDEKESVVSHPHPRWKWIVRVLIEYSDLTSEITYGYGSSQREALSVAVSPFNMSRKSPRKPEYC